MRKITLFILFLYTSFAFSQLEGNDWSLIDLIIDGSSYESDIVQSEAESNYQNLTFLNNHYETTLCGVLQADLNIDINNTQFFLTNLTETAMDCSTTESTILQNLYFGFFNNNVPNAFQYELDSFNDVHGNVGLVITDINGNQALFETRYVSVDDFINASFSLYPNPVKNVLIIKEESNLNMDNITIYNFLGKELFSTKNKRINTSKMNPGIYFVRIKLQNNKVVVKKFIKK